MLRWGDVSKKQDLPVPRLLRRALAVLFYLLLLSYLVTASDAWLHATSKATIIQSTTPIQSGSLQADFGRAINTTQCTEAMATSSPDSSFYASCGQILGLAGHDSGPIREGLRTISNSSSINRVAFTDDQTAILVPDTLPANISYTAKTLGFKASCKRFVITLLCSFPCIPTRVNFQHHKRVSRPDDAGRIALLRRCASVEPELPRPHRLQFHVTIQ